MVWTLSVAADRSANLSAADGNGQVLLTLGIHRTDFPLDEVRLFLIDGPLLLPNEY